MPVGIGVGVVAFPDRVLNGSSLCPTFFTFQCAGLNAVSVPRLGRACCPRHGSQAGFVELSAWSILCCHHHCPATKTSLRYIRKVAQELDVRICIINGAREHTFHLSISDQR